MDKIYTNKLYSRKIPCWNELPEIDLYMDQIIALMEKYLGSNSKDKLITPSMINNYVKLGIVPPPIKYQEFINNYIEQKKKKYSTDPTLSIPKYSIPEGEEDQKI